MTTSSFEETRAQRVGWHHDQEESKEARNLRIRKKQGNLCDAVKGEGMLSKQRREASTSSTFGAPDKWVRSI
jgi:hypothetical protein